MQNRSTDPYAVTGLTPWQRLQSLQDNALLKIDVDNSSRLLRITRPTATPHMLHGSSLPTPFPFKDLSRNVQTNLPVVCNGVAINGDPFSHPVTAEEITSKMVTPWQSGPNETSVSHVLITPLAPSVVGNSVTTNKASGTAPVTTWPDFAQNAFLRRQNARVAEKPTVSSPPPTTAQGSSLTNGHLRATSPHLTVRHFVKPLPEVRPFTTDDRFRPSRSPVISGPRLVERSSSVGVAVPEVTRPKTSPAKGDAAVDTLLRATSSSWIADDACKRTQSDSESSTDSKASGSRMPVTGTVTGTVFYRKSSRTEELIYCPHPPRNSEGDQKEPKNLSNNCAPSLYQQVKQELEAHKQKLLETSSNKDAANSSEPSSSGITCKPTRAATVITTTREGTENALIISDVEKSSKNSSETVGISVPDVGAVNSEVRNLQAQSKLNNLIAATSSTSEDKRTSVKTQKRVRIRLQNETLETAASREYHNLGERQPGDGEADPGEFEEERKHKRQRPVTAPPRSGKENDATRVAARPKSGRVVSCRQGDQEDSGDESDRNSTSSSNEDGGGEEMSSTGTVDGDGVSSSEDEGATKEKQGRPSPVRSPSPHPVSTWSLSAGTVRSPSVLENTRSLSRAATPGATIVTTSPKKWTRPGWEQAKITRATLEEAQVQSQHNPPLLYSKFPNVPPVINFVNDGEKIEQLPWELRRLLRWRSSIMTPIVVKQIITRSGFRPSKLTTPVDDLESVDTNDWIFYFGKHMKGPVFKTIREYQKVNHLPGSFQLGRKDRLWRNLHKLQLKFGRREFSFFPQTYCLPNDLKQFKQMWEEDGGSKHMWIIKPPASARGIGVRVVYKWNQIPKKRPIIVQRYLANPYLINGNKFDLRIYVYVSCISPLRVYVHEEGLVRFASHKYSMAVRTLCNRFIHLTNYSVNKQNVEYTSNDDDEASKGHKWSLKALWSYLRRNSVNPEPIWENIKDLVVKTVISAEHGVEPVVQSFVRRHYSVHELFGFDVLLDDELKPWILEVNVSPSLHSNSQLDVKVKGAMLRDMFNLAGYQLPDPTDVASTNTPNFRPATDLPDYHRLASDLYTDKRLWDPPLGPDESSKRAYYADLYRKSGSIDDRVLDPVTPADVRCLVEAVDEWDRADGFQRVFPTSASARRYLRYLEQARYENLLLAAYLNRYSKWPEKGAQWLTSLCRRRIHLQSPLCGPVDPKHVWVHPDPQQRTVIFRTPSGGGDTASSTDSVE